MVMPVDPNSTILTGSASPSPVIIPIEDEPHVITKIIGISIMCVGGMQMVGSLFSFGTIGLNNWLESSMGSEVGGRFVAFLVLCCHGFDSINCRCYFFVFWLSDSNISEKRYLDHTRNRISFKHCESSN